MWHIFCRPETKGKFALTPFHYWGVEGSGRGFETHNTLITRQSPFLIFNSLNVEGGCNSRLKLSFPLPPCPGGLAPHFGCSICCLGPPPKPRLKCFQHPVARVLQIYYLISCFHTCVHADGPWIMSITCLKAYSSLNHVIPIKLSAPHGLAFILKKPVYWGTANEQKTSK